MKATILHLICLLLPISIIAQPEIVQLPKPTGIFPVGTITYEWKDSSRELALTSSTKDKRVVVVQLWYPAVLDSNSQEAQYSPLSKDYKHVKGNSYLRPSFNPEVKNAPLILIAPGRGTERYLYTSICEELASHGYVVASVDMPEIGYVIYGDGYTVKPAQRFRPPRGLMAGPYEKVDEFFEEPTAIGNADLTFIMKKIVELNTVDPAGRFTSGIDIGKIGIFGHSLGGRIAGKFAATYPGVRAYISMEGIAPRDIRYEGKLNIPIALLCSSGTWPYAKDNYFSLINNRNTTIFMVELSDFGHNSVTDNPLAYPGHFKYAIPPIEGINISRKITLAYFNSIFRNGPAFQKAIAAIQQVTINTYP